MNMASNSRIQSANPDCGRLNNNHLVSSVEVTRRSKRYKTIGIYKLKESRKTPKQS